MSNSSDLATGPLSFRCGSSAGTTPSIYICGVPDLNQPQYIQVTLTGQFTPVTGYFIGGRTMTLQETATVQTVTGDAATSSDSLAGTSVCAPLS
jgi:hypothetical protein